MSKRLTEHERVLNLVIRRIKAKQKEQRQMRGGVVGGLAWLYRLKEILEAPRLP